jgi:hypothetical protein
MLLGFDKLESMGSAVIYSSFPTLVPTQSNKVVGAINTDDHAYCRYCIEQLGLEWDKMKPLTNRRAKMYIYTCYRCGWKITKKRAKQIYNV